MPQSPSDALDTYALADMAERQIPAVVWGVFKDGEILDCRAYGLASVELQAKATTESVFEIGSVSKQFTAVAILMLMEEGKLGLDDRVDGYLEDLPEPWREATLRQLLAHTSGIPDMEEIFGYDSYRNIYTPQALIEVANSRPMDFAPGKGWHYSNTGYFLAALVLERVAGKSYPAFLKEKIFDPIGMAQTRESDPTVIIPHRSAGYQVDAAGVLRNRDAMQPSACLGAGTLVSNLADMAKWDAALNHRRFLRPETYELMWSPNGEHAYGLGWFLGSYRGHPCVSHAGGTAGFSCNYRRFHDTGYSTMAFTNLYGINVGGIEIRISDRVMPGISYASREAIPDEEGRRERLLKAMAEVAEGGSGSLFITDKMWASYSDASRQAWKDRLDGLKRFDLIVHERHDPRQTPFGESVVETSIYRLATESKELFIVFTLDAAGKIALQTREDG